MLELRDVRLRRGAAVLFDKANVTIFRGDKIGIVGRNGCGKSSLLALLRGDLGADAGEYKVPGKLNFVSVSQELPRTEATVLEYVRSGDGRLMQIPGAAIIVMSAHDKQWTPNRTRYLRASTAGSFAIAGLPPGEYLIVAIDDALAEGWQDSRVLAQLRTLATRIVLREAETRTLELRLSALRR